MTCVDVLVPVRQPAAWLPQALASLAAQEGASWRAVLCPLDEQAARISDGLAAGHPGLTARPVVAKESEALAAAAGATGSDRLCVLDGDDLLHPHALAVLNARLDATPDAGMAYSRHMLVDVVGRTLGPGPLCELAYTPEALLLDFMAGPLRLLRRTALDLAGGFQARFPHADDYDLCLRLSERVGVVHDSAVLYARRIHPTAPEVSHWAQRIEARYRAFVAAVERRGLGERFDTALQVDAWHVLEKRERAEAGG